MSKQDRKQSKSSITNTTSIGSVTGQVHTGSGDIIVKSFTSESKLSTKEEFLAALDALKAEMDTAHQQGIPEETIKKAVAEVEMAEQEAVMDKPKIEGIVERLDKAKAILVAGTGIATATTGAIMAMGKLIPLFDTAAKYVSTIFR